MPGKAEGGATERDLSKTRLISPLAGEMSGRTEGGATKRNCRPAAQEAHP
jgi:hypothetical protein